MALDGVPVELSGNHEQFDSAPLKAATSNGCDLEARLSIAEERCMELSRALELERVERANEADALASRLTILENELKFKAAQVDKMDAGMLELAHRCAGVDDVLQSETLAREASTSGLQSAIEELVQQVQARLDASQSALHAHSECVETAIQSLVRRVDTAVERGTVEIAEAALEGMLSRIDEAVYKNVSKYVNPEELPQQEPQAAAAVPSAAMGLSSPGGQDSSSSTSISVAPLVTTSTTSGIGSASHTIATTTPPTGPLPVVVVERPQAHATPPVTGNLQFPFGAQLQGAVSGRGSPAPCGGLGRESSPRGPNVAGAPPTVRLQQGPLANNSTPRRQSPKLTTSAGRLPSQEMREQNPAAQISNAVAKVLGGANSFTFLDSRPLPDSTTSSTTFLAGGGVQVRGSSPPHAPAMATSAMSPTKPMTTIGAPPSARPFTTPELSSRSSPSMLHRVTTSPWSTSTFQGGAGMPFMHQTTPRQTSPRGIGFGSPTPIGMPLRQQPTVTSSPILR